jgi:hypothetical protein
MAFDTVAEEVANRRVRETVMVFESNGYGDGE